VEIGLLIAVCISFVKILFNVTRPHTARLGNIPGTNVYRNVQQYPDAVLAPGIVAVRVDAAIYFSNSQYIHDKVLRYVEDEVARQETTGGAPIRYLIVDVTRKLQLFLQILFQYLFFDTMYDPALITP